MFWKYYLLLFYRVLFDHKVHKDKLVIYPTLIGTDLKKWEPFYFVSKQLNMKAHKIVLPAYNNV